MSTSVITFGKLESDLIYMRATYCQTTFKPRARTVKSRLEVLDQLGLRNITIAPLHRFEDGINAARVFLPKCWFDAAKCARGIEALKLYRSEYDEKLQVLKPRAIHDWASHAADAFRYLAMTLDRTVLRKGFNKRIEYPTLGLV